DLDVAGQPDPGDLAQRRVRLLRRGRVDTQAHAPALGASLERRSLVLGDLVLAALADQLLDRGHYVSVVLVLVWRRVCLLSVSGCRCPGIQLPGWWTPAATPAVGRV